MFARIVCVFARFMPEWIVGQALAGILLGLARRRGCSLIEIADLVRDQTGEAVAAVMPAPALVRLMLTGMFAEVLGDLSLPLGPVDGPLH